MFRQKKMVVRNKNSGPFTGCVEDALKAGNKVSLIGFGSFEQKSYPYNARAVIPAPKRMSRSPLARAWRSRPAESTNGCKATATRNEASSGCFSSRQYMNTAPTNCHSCWSCIYRRGLK